VVSSAKALVGTWKQELAAERPIRAFTNMTMAPTPVDLVASAIVHVMEDRLPLRVKHEVVEVRKVGIYQRCKVKEFRLMIEF
jgi:dTDP-4-dehydrorhamnose reductase